MKGLPLFPVAVILILSLLSCKGKTYKLSDTDFGWLPYKEMDTLVFISNTGYTDSLFLKNGYEHKRFEVDPLSIKPPDSTETYQVSYKYNFFDSIQQLRNFRVLPLIVLERTKEKSTKIGFPITITDGSNCGLKYFTIDYLNSMKLISLQTSLKKYDDIFIIEPDRNCSSPSKLYWSKSNGLVRYDQQDNTSYTLIKKRGLE